MVFKIKDFLYEHHTIAILLGVAFKFILMGLSPADCLASFILLLSSLAFRIVCFKLPKQPDLKVQMDSLQSQIQKMITKTDEIERDVTGLKFAKGPRL